MLISNANTKIVTIDSTTSGSFSNTMTISNLVLSAPGASVNTLRLLNAGTAKPLRVLDSFAIGSGGAVVITGSTLQVDGMLGGSFVVNGTVMVGGGNIIVTNTSFYVGSSGRGSMTTSNGTSVLAGYGAVGAANLTSGSQGTLTIAGGTQAQTSALDVGLLAGDTGTVWVTTGQLLITNDFLTVGSFGIGQMAISNGTVRAHYEVVGNISDAQGTVTVAGGTNIVDADFTVSGGGTGTVWITGGKLFATNGTTMIGGGASGTMTVSNGLLLLQQMGLGGFSGSVGTLTIVGGTTTVISNLVLGDCLAGSTGMISLMGGTLYVTNAAHNAFLDVRSGTVSIGNGILMVDRLVMTNSCGLFVRNGGTFSAGSLLLDPALSATGDGLPNGWKQQYGLDPLSSSGRNGPNDDPDGDGVSNVQEFTAGTDPTNSASYFHVVSVTSTGGNVFLTWMCGARRTNVLQAVSPLTATYTNISPNIVLTGSGLVTTNFLDIGGTTNSAARFYRVRLVP